MDKTILIATKNRHKVQEMAPILETYGYKLQPADLPKIEIQADTLQEIVAYAARHIPAIDRPVIIEDAGLFIKALNGFPGPYSHYVYQTIGCRGILQLLQQATDRTAVFQSAIALKTPTGETHIFTGETIGTIVTEPRGTGGFGFDPIFQPQGTDKTYAEMTLQEKNLYSHRAKATRKLAEHLATMASLY
ncbi:XTP/dITP diphosphatase [Thermofilum sp.]|uniref:XTP/dITP diphosphatase n=1 Tax=Thermofilum sp. TaxID=1961369 RepID=UPI0025904628|nr:XTP/dITP diphosphatase [Thermofilum sp.]